MYEMKDNALYYGDCLDLDAGNGQGDSVDLGVSGSAI